jgi:hypothetical protein
MTELSATFPSQELNNKSNVKRGQKLAGYSHPIIHCFNGSMASRADFNLPMAALGIHQDYAASEEHPRSYSTTENDRYSAGFSATI